MQKGSFIRERLVDSEGKEKARCVELPEIQAVFGPGWRAIRIQAQLVLPVSRPTRAHPRSTKPEMFARHRTATRSFPPACRRRPVI